MITGARSDIRYLNNPEAMGAAAWFGLSLISGSKLVLSLAVVRHLANWWFLTNVEKCVSELRPFIQQLTIHSARTCAKSMATLSERMLVSSR